MLSIVTYTATIPTRS